MDDQKVFKTLDFLFLIILNNIAQLQLSVSCIRMSNVGIFYSFERIQARILPMQIQSYIIRIQNLSR